MVTSRYIVRLILENAIWKFLHTWYSCIDREFYADLDPVSSLKVLVCCSRVILDILPRLFRRYIFCVASQIMIQALKEIYTGLRRLNLTAVYVQILYKELELRWFSLSNANICRFMLPMEIIFCYFQLIIAPKGVNVGCCMYLGHHSLKFKFIT